MESGASGWAPSRPAANRKAEKAKIALSSTLEYGINLPFITADASGPKHIDLKLTRAKMDQLCEDLFDRTLGPVKKCLQDGVGMEDRVCVAVCPPFPYLALVALNLKGSSVALGAQNLYPEKEGAFTGEVSPTMLLDLGCKFVILGHSERRHKLGESNGFIDQKVHVALDAGLNVILCVGETLEQREAKQTTEVLEQQIILGLAALSADTLPRLSIAYEPIWAIGNTGHHATPEQAEVEHIVIRKRLAQMFGKPAQSTVIQYGGSVKPENAAALLIQPNVDGALIGGASLKADQFLSIVQVAIQQTQIEEKLT